MSDSKGMIAKLRAETLDRALTRIQDVRVLQDMSGGDPESINLVVDDLVAAVEVLASAVALDVTISMIDDDEAGAA